MIVTPKSRRFLPFGLFHIAVVAQSAIMCISASAEAQMDQESNWGDEGDDLSFGAFEQQNAQETKEQDSVNEETAETDDVAEAGDLSWGMCGFARSDWGIWANRLTDNAFAKGRQNLDLAARFRKKFASLLISGHAEYDFAYLNERDSYRESTLDTYEWLVDFRESHFALSFDHVDFTTGLQIVPWGEGDLLGLLDVVNPRDNREPGLVQMDDLRLPVLSTRLGFFWGHHRIEGMVVHQANHGLRTPPYGPFSPFPNVVRSNVGDLFSDEPNPAASMAVFDELVSMTDFEYVHTPGQSSISLDTHQYFARWSYRGPGVDIGLYFASVLDHVGVIEWSTDIVMKILGAYLAQDPDEEISDLDIETVKIPLKHGRYTMLGHSGALPISNWLLKWELSTEINRPYNFQGIDEKYTDLLGIEIPGLTVIEATTFGFLLGVSYSGFRDTQIFAEFSERFFVKDYPEPLYPVDAASLAFGYMRSLVDVLSLEAIISLLGWNAKHGFFESGWIARLQLTYNIVDALKMTLGYIYYEPETGLGILSGLTNHDRLYLNLRWDFTIH